MGPLPTGNLKQLIVLGHEAIRAKTRAPQGQGNQEEGWTVSGNTSIQEHIMFDMFVMQ